MARRYAFLRFKSGVDWRDVNPVLLARMNRVGMYLHKVITVVSGARTPQGNMGAPHSHHVPQNNPSGQGEAVDVYVGDKPLGSVISVKVAARFGLFSGNRPGFYKGGPDPEHFETLERRGESYKGSSIEPTAQPAAPAAAPAATDTSSLPPVEEPQLASTPPAPESSLPPVYAPGSVPAGGLSPQEVADRWRLIASQPLAGSDSQLFADSASLAAGG